MRQYLIGGIGLVMAALFFTVPAATAEAHPAHALRHARWAHAYPARPVYPIAPRVYVPYASPLPGYAPAVVVPRVGYRPYWHHHR